VQYIDVAASEEAKQRMRDLSGNPKALPPQIFNEEQYCGVRNWLYIYGCMSVHSKYTRVYREAAFDVTGRKTSTTSSVVVSFLGMHDKKAVKSCDL